MKQCKKCGCHNNDKSRFCYNCGNKFPDRKRLYVVINAVVAFTIIGLCGLSYYLWNNFDLDNSDGISPFWFVIFHFIPGIICFLSLVVHIIIVYLCKSDVKYEVLAVIPFVILSIGTIMSISAVIFAIIGVLMICFMVY